MGFLGQLFAAQNNFQATNPNSTNVAPTLTGALAQPGQTLGQEQNLAQALQQQMTGGGPNLAQTQLQGATDRANSQAAGLIGSAQGLNPSTAARQILNQQAQNNQGMANQSAQLQQQQQLAAQQQLGSVLANQGQLGLGQVGTLGNLQLGQNAQNLQAQGMTEQAQLANQGAANNFLPGLLGGVGALGQGAAKAGQVFNEGGEVHDFQDGGDVPGQAQVAGDSPDNDTVHAMVSPGEYVMKRSDVAQVKQAGLDPDKVADFVSAFTGQPKASGYGAVLQAKRKVRNLN